MAAFDHHAGSDEGHGRNEGRSVAVSYDPARLPEGRPGVKAVVEVVRRCQAGGASMTSRYYVSIRAGTACGLAGLTRGHRRD